MLKKNQKPFHILGTNIPRNQKNNFIKNGQRNVCNEFKEVKDLYKNKQTKEPFKTLKKEINEDNRR